MRCENPKDSMCFTWYIHMKNIICKVNGIRKTRFLCFLNGNYEIRRVYSVWEGEIRIFFVFHMVFRMFLGFVQCMEC